MVKERQRAGFKKGSRGESDKENLEWGVMGLERLFNISTYRLLRWCGSMLIVKRENV